MQLKAWHLLGDGGKSVRDGRNKGGFVKLFVVLSLLLGSVSFAGEQLELDFGNGHCVNLDQAKTRLTEYLGQSPIDTITEDFPFWSEVDEDGNHNLTNKDVLKSVLDSLAFDKIFENYQTEAVAVGECAPAAECWGWYVVSCEGKVEARLDGED